MTLSTINNVYSFDLVAVLVSPVRARDKDSACIFQLRKEVDILDVLLTLRLFWRTRQ